MMKGLEEMTSEEMELNVYNQEALREVNRR